MSGDLNLQNVPTFHEFFVMQKDTTEKLAQIQVCQEEIRGDIKLLKSKFDSLPCKANTQKIDEHEAYKNKAMGMIVIVGMVAGFIGWILTPFIGWLLGKLR